MRKIFGFGAALVGALALGGTAIAQPHGEWGHGPMEFLHSLSLSEAQQSQVHQIMKSGFEASKPIMQQLHAAHEAEMTQLLAAGEADTAALQQSMAKEENLRQQLDTQHLNTMLQLRAVLTPEQLATAATKHAEIEKLHAQEHALMGAPE